MKTWEEYSVELAKAKVNFYEPFERLVLRKIVQDILIPCSSIKFDLFSIYDGVSKRGGFARVQQQKRWIQIQYSLPYYKINFKQIYTEHILKHQLELKRYLQLHNRAYTVKEECFVELHYIATSCAGGYYHFEDDENSFCKQNFQNVDLYLNIKTICFNKCPLSKIITQYSDKYLLTRKWMIMKGYSRPFSQQQLNNLQIIKLYNNNSSIALVGWNLATLMLAMRLHQLKFNVVLYTNYDEVMSIAQLERVMCVQEGVFLLDDGVGGPFSYFDLLTHYHLQLCEVSNYCGFIDREANTIPENKVRQTQQLFLAMMVDFKFQEGNQNLLWDQLSHLMAKKKINDDLGLIRWHLERYLFLNNFHGNDTTVNLHYNYLSRRKHKIFMSRRRPLYLKSCQSLIQKCLKSFTIVNSKPKSIDFCNNMWIIEEKQNQRKSFSSMVFGDAASVADMIVRKSFKMPNMREESFRVFEELDVAESVVCRVRFKEKIKVRAQVMVELLRRRTDFMKVGQYPITQHNCSFQFQGQYGFYFYHITQNGHTLLCSSNSNLLIQQTNGNSQQIRRILSAQMLKQFQRVISKGKLPEVEENVVESSFFFYSSQDTITRDRIIKLKNFQRMYLGVGLPYALNPNKLSAQIDGCNQILALIANVYYHLYKFQQKAKHKFSREYTLKRQQIIRMRKSQQHQHKQTPNPPTPNNPKIPQQPTITIKPSHTIQMPNQDDKVRSQQQNKVVEQVRVDRLEGGRGVRGEKGLRFRLRGRVYPLLMGGGDVGNRGTCKGIGDQGEGGFGLGCGFVRQSYRYLQQEIGRVLSQYQTQLNTLQSLPPQQQPSNPYPQLLNLLTSFTTTFQLSQPLKLTPTLYLHSIGHCTIEPLSLNKILTQFKQAELLKYQGLQARGEEQGRIEQEGSSERVVEYGVDVRLFNGYVAKTVGYSVDQPWRLTVYVEAIVYVNINKSNNQTDNNNSNNTNSNATTPLFIIFHPSNLSLFYYHTCYRHLLTKFHSHINNLRKSMPFLTIRPSNLQHQLKSPTTNIQILLNQIKHKIEQELKFGFDDQFLTPQQTLTKLLQQKLTAQVNEDIFDNPSQNNLYEKIILPETNQEKTVFLMTSLNHLVREQLHMHGLRHDISLMDLFFGYLSPGYFVYEMIFNRIKSLTPAKSTIQDICQQLHLKHPQLYNEIAPFITPSQSLHSNYPLSISFTASSLTIQRKFLSSKNDPLTIVARTSPQTQKTYHVLSEQLAKNFTFVKQWNLQERRNERVRWFLVIGEKGERIDLDPKENPLELIVSILVDTWDIAEIYQHFRQLITQEIQQCQYNLSSHLKLYYTSTRKQPSPIQLSQLPTLSRILTPIPPSQYSTPYYTTQQSKQTILEHLQTQTMFIADEDIIVCKY